MVKGIISKVENKYSYRVRIPLYHKAKNTPGCVPDDQLPYATVCTPPGIFPLYQENDVVWIDFENNELDVPVILGLLYKESGSKAISDINCQSINVEVETTLPKETSIGKVSKDIQSLPQIIDKLDNIQGGSQHLEFIVTDEDLKIIETN